MRDRGPGRSAEGDPDIEEQMDQGEEIEPRRQHREVQVTVNLVVMGLSWIMDYGPTFSSTARPETINTIYAWTASEDWELNKIDMKVFFLHGELDKPVYMTQPKGYETGKGKVCKVYKSIYGMPNASRVSAKKLYGVLKDAGYVQCKSDEKMKRGKQ